MKLEMPDSAKDMGWLLPGNVRVLRDYNVLHQNMVLRLDKVVDGNQVGKTIKVTQSEYQKMKTVLDFIGGVDG